MQDFSWTHEMHFALPNCPGLVTIGITNTHVYYVLHWTLVKQQQQ